MDAQKISQAASDIKKADHALGWLKQRDAKNALRIDTKGSMTAAPGHGEAKDFLHQALEQKRNELFELAISIATKQKEFSQDVIRQEVAEEERDGNTL